VYGRHLVDQLITGDRRITPRRFHVSDDNPNNALLAIFDLSSTDKLQDTAFRYLTPTPTGNVVVMVGQDIQRCRLVSTQDLKIAQGSTSTSFAFLKHDNNYYYPLAVGKNAGNANHGCHAQSMKSGLTCLPHPSLAPLVPSRHAYRNSELGLIANDNTCSWSQRQPLVCVPSRPLQISASHSAPTSALSGSNECS
jgi:hypothetical protein